MSLVRKIGRALLNVGIDPRAVLALRHIPKYLRDRRKWVRGGGTITASNMILVDYESSAGTAKGHYFHQDLLIAQKIFEAAPQRHIDVGSRVDGFAAHVASFREIEVVDVRDMAETGYRNISFRQADLMQPQDLGVTDSLSCLHAIEHFGLGRYGDGVDPTGHIEGINNLIRLLEPGGTLYISFPIGKGDEVHFNAHRVFHPETILSLGDVPSLLTLKNFNYVDDQGFLHRDKQVTDAIDQVAYGCGIYVFERKAS